MFYINRHLCPLDTLETWLGLVMYPVVHIRNLPRNNNNSIFEKIPWLVSELYPCVFTRDNIDLSRVTSSVAWESQ